MPIRFQVGLPGPFVWQPKGKSDGDTGGLRIYSGPPLNTAQRIAYAQNQYESSRRVCRWIALAWMIWSVFWIGVWLFTPGTPWSWVGYSLAVWVLGAGALLFKVRADEEALENELDKRDQEWADEVERQRLKREADEGHARWLDTL